MTSFMNRTCGLVKKGLFFEVTIEGSYNPAPSLIHSTHPVRETQAELVEQLNVLEDVVV